MMEVTKEEKLRRIYLERKNRNSKVKNIGQICGWNTWKGWTRIEQRYRMEVTKEKNLESVIEIPEKN